MQKIKSEHPVLKVIILILTLLIGSLFVNSCSLINSYPQDFSVTNKAYISEDNNYVLKFKETNGTLRNKKTDIIIEFDYYYDSGIIIGNYEEIVEKNNETIIENKELVFAYVYEEILYCQFLHQLFKLN